MTETASATGSTSARRLALTRTPKGLLLVEEAIPSLDAGCVRIRVRKSLVSPGSELGGWEQLARGEMKGADGRPFGYSNVGVVEQVGESVRRLAPGDRVAAIGAGKALHATHAVVPQNLVFKLPESMSEEEGTFAMLLATALHGVRRAQVQIGDYAAVVGLGLVGLLSGRFLQLAGCRTIGWDRNALRCRMGSACGLDRAVVAGEEDPVAACAEFTGGLGLDAALWALSGNADAVWDATMAAMKCSSDGHREGRIAIVGHPEFSFRTRPMTNVDIVQASRTGYGYHDATWERGADYPGTLARWNTRRNVEFAFACVARGEFDLPSLVSHRVALTEAAAALPSLAAEGPGTLGVILTMEASADRC